MITAEQVKKLREATGLGIIDCKGALDKTNGNHDEAIDLLRTLGKQVNEKRVDKVTSCGLIDTYVHGGQVAVMVEIACETSFCVKSDDFKKLAHDIAMQLAAVPTLYIDRTEIPDMEISREKNIHERVAKEMGKPQQAIEKIVGGKMEKFFSENCLLDAISIFDKSMKVKDMINAVSNKVNEKITIKRFIRWNVE
jgi:elongation factor Ts